MAEPDPQSAQDAGELDEALLRAISHPLRHRLLGMLDGRVASPNQLARELGLPLGRVSYHIRLLSDLGAIELVRTEPRRGALEHFYRAQIRPWFDDEMSSQLPNSVRRALFGEILSYIWGDVVAAAEAEGFDDPKTHVTRTPLDLDEEAYEDVVDLLNSVVERALKLHAEAAPRLAKLPPEERDAHRTALMIMHFHRPRGESTA